MNKYTHMASDIINTILFSIDQNVNPGCFGIKAKDKLKEMVSNK